MPNPKNVLEKFHFYYFCYFNHWYQDGKPKIIIPGLEAKQRPLAVLVFFPWVLFCDIRLIATCLFHLKPDALFNGYAELGQLLFFWSAYNQYFIKTDRFRAIYVQYRSTDYRIQNRVFSTILVTLICVLFTSATAFFLFFLYWKYHQY